MKLLGRLLTDPKKHTVLSVQGRVPAVLLLFVVLSICSVLKASAAIVGEEFLTAQTFSTGSVVSIDRSNPNDIVLANLNNSQYLLGVVNDQGSNVVTYAKDSARTTVSVAGEVSVYVTDANGTIEQGDFVGASWIEGIAMLATADPDQKLLGVALESFESNESGDYGAIETPSGEKSVNVGAIRIRLFDKEGIATTTSTKSGLENLLGRIAGREVSVIKIIAVAAIFMMSLLIAGFFISSSIRGSFIAIGRNPLASTSVFQGLLHVTLVSVIVIVIGTALSYVVLVV